MDGLTILLIVLILSFPIWVCVQSIIDYKKYGVPEISMENEQELEDRGEDVLEIIDVPIIYPNDIDKHKLDNHIQRIVDLTDKEVKNSNNTYKPKDFLYLYPIMKNNIAATELQTKLNQYWIDQQIDID